MFVAGYVLYFNVMGLRIFLSTPPFIKGGCRGILIAFRKISPHPSLEKMGAVVLKSMTFQQKLRCMKILTMSGLLTNLPTSLRKEPKDGGKSKYKT